MIETVPAIVCDICKAYLALPRLLIKEYLEITIGIHDEVFSQWEPPMPVMKATLVICLEHGQFPVLVDDISKIVSFDILGINQAELDHSRGHFITAVQIVNGHGEFFNLRVNKEDFIKILCKFPIFAHVLYREWEKPLDQPC
jgi:hypothetical protein